MCRTMQESEGAGRGQSIARKGVGLTLDLDSANMGVGNGNVRKARTTSSRATGDEWSVACDSMNTTLRPPESVSFDTWKT